MAQHNGFVMFRRTDGTEVACRIAQILYVGKGVQGAVLHFGSGTQVNLHDSFEDVIALLTVES